MGRKLGESMGRPQPGGGFLLSAAWGPPTSQPTADKTVFKPTKGRQMCKYNQELIAETTEGHTNSILK
jgi:hypothetical protein